MKKQLQTLVAGALIVVPLVISIYIVLAIGGAMDGLVGRAGRLLLPWLVEEGWRPWPGAGVLLVLIVLYLAGLATRAYGFRTAFGYVDRLFTQLPGVKTIYESVRDLMKLFGGDKGTMGKAVLYHEPGTGITRLGIMTNDNPAGVVEHLPGHKVAVFLPYGYMFGGMVVYVCRDCVQEIPLGVDQVLKLCATAHVGARAPEVEGAPVRPAALPTPPER